MQRITYRISGHNVMLGMEREQMMPVRGRHGARIPVAMSRGEVPILLDSVQGADGVYRVACEIMYESGARVRDLSYTGQRYGPG